MTRPLILPFSCCRWHVDLFSSLITYYNVFQFFFRRIKKPLKPKVVIQVATDSSDVPLPVPLLGAFFTADLESTVVFAYGNFMKPIFEKAVSSKPGILSNSMMLDTW